MPAKGRPSDLRVSPAALPGAREAVERGYPAKASSRWMWGLNRGQRTFLNSEVGEHLVGSPGFKPGGAATSRPVGSFPIRLRQY